MAVSDHFYLAILRINFVCRRNGAGEIYAYLPKTEQNLAAQKAVSGFVENDRFGNSIGRGLFTWPTGQWVSVAQYVKLNDPPTAYNGEVKVYINGALVINVTGLALTTRANESSTFQGMQFQTFFGGVSIFII